MKLKTYTAMALRYTSNSAEGYPIEVRASSLFEAISKALEHVKPGFELGRVREK